MRPIRYAQWLMLGLLVLFASCRSSPATVSQPTDTLDDVLRRGEIRAGYFVEPPAVFKDSAAGEPRGTFVEAIRAIAAALKVKVTFVEVDLAKFAAGLQTRMYDVSIGPTFKTIQRAQNVAFVDTIFYLGYDGIVKKGRAAEFKTEQSIDRKGVTVAVKEGSAIHQYVRDNFKNAKLLVLTGDDLSLPLQAVSSGQADVGLMNEHTVEFYLREHQEVEVIFANSPIQIAGMSWAVRPNDQKWLNFLNTSIEFLISTGKMGGWERQYYFGQTLRRTLPEPSAPTAR